MKEKESAKNSQHSKEKNALFVSFARQKNQTSNGAVHAAEQLWPKWRKYV